MSSQGSRQPSGSQGGSALGTAPLLGDSLLLVVTRREHASPSHAVGSGGWQQAEREWGQGSILQSDGGQWQSMCHTGLMWGRAGEVALGAWKRPVQGLVSMWLHRCPAGHRLAGCQ